MSAFNLTQKKLTLNCPEAAEKLEALFTLGARNVPEPPNPKGKTFKSESSPKAANTS